LCAATVANSTPACVSATCTHTCNSGYTPCNGACVNLLTDRNNCGMCGSTYACLNGLSCVSGGCECVAAGCPSSGCGLTASACCTSAGKCGCTGLLGIGCN
jgi:hypothetical protein